MSAASAMSFATAAHCAKSGPSRRSAPVGRSYRAAHLSACQRDERCLSALARSHWLALARVLRVVAQQIATKRNAKEKAKERQRQRRELGNGRAVGSGARRRVGDRITCDLSRALGALLCGAQRKAVVPLRASVSQQWLGRYLIARSVLAHNSVLAQRAKCCSFWPKALASKANERRMVCAGRVVCVFLCTSQRRAAISAHICVCAYGRHSSNEALLLIGARTLVRPFVCARGHKLRAEPLSFSTNETRVWFQVALARRR